MCVWCIIRTICLEKILILLMVCSLFYAFSYLLKSNSLLIQHSCLLFFSIWNWILYWMGILCYTHNPFTIVKYITQPESFYSIVCRSIWCNSWLSSIPFYEIISRTLKVQLALRVQIDNISHFRNSKYIKFFWRDRCLGAFWRTAWRAILCAYIFLYSMENENE